MGWIQNFAKQFQHPVGFWGHVAGNIMALSTGARNTWTLSFLDIQGDDRVLEIGYGPGIGIYQCSQMIQQGKVIGIDVSDTMYKQAMRRNRKAIQEGKVELRISAIENLPISDKPFNKIYSVNSVMFWSDQQAAFRKLYSLLKPGGTIATTYQPIYKGATKEDAINYAEKLSSILQQVGFTEISKELKEFKPVAAVCIVARRN
ncbi:class I SAM-dependent methyltransferase [Paenactinomyces guangxiensis]|uniref:Class I SAM-dependent methyltransferase n=1 Tax=Paenactinomyces guangxiensis TaxID=1490290 RepID=A0A7W1WUG4_9BACL|nr:class I SAM-dependent methyltransferase [Paenactinomyces guangxiensis]MBA4496076.1 class I SAM-dependent methyltransferase [Paenactinomyces guangxiensis]MBH8593164.1 class I SAM-dependent methyltransferase [Paenactinomyces guangxiensis]